MQAQGTQQQHATLPAALHQQQILPQQQAQQQQPRPQQPQQPLRTGAQTGGAGRHAGAVEDEEDAFWGDLDVDGLMQQRGVAPAAPARPAAAAPARPAVPQPQQSTQPLTMHAPGGTQQPGYGSRALPPAAGPVCSHGVPYGACAQQQQHLDEIQRQVADAALQMADASGPQLAALQQEVKRLRDLKQLLEAAAPPPAAQQQRPMGSAPPYASQQQQQQHYGQGGGQWVQPPPPPQQQQQQQWGGTQRFGGPPPPAGGGYGGGSGSGRLAGAAGPSYQEPGGGYGGGHGGGGGYGAGGEFGGGDSYGGGGGYEQGPPAPLWEPDQAALRNVRAEQEDATRDPK